MASLAAEPGAVDLWKPLGIVGVESAEVLQHLFNVDTDAMYDGLERLFASSDGQNWKMVADRKVGLPDAELEAKSSLPA